jgi:hypothetical protein
VLLSRQDRVYLLSLLQRVVMRLTHIASWKDGSVL